jgi:predicted dehydrogenase
VGREVVDAYYANQRGRETSPGCRTYADFRDLLDKEKDLDAVKIMTPDHLHAAIAIAAMNKGKHVVVHKPLANRLAEGRLVVETARQTKVTTHLLAHGSGRGNALICQRIKEGVIGKLREIHNWTNRPVWPQYTEIPHGRPPIPKGFDWDLWLGPALDRPYHPHYTHTVFRGWYDFGGGSMADMGIYSLWPVFTELDLDVPVSAEAWATHTCTIVDHVSRTAVNDFAYPTACTLRFQFAASARRPALDLFWYDGGMKPRFPEAIEAQNVTQAPEGILFVGDQGSILAGFHGDNPQLFARGKREALFQEGTSRRGTRPTKAGVRSISWVQGIKEGVQSPGSFLNAGSITDTVNLGTVALRAGKKVLFDSRTMQVTNLSAANKFLYRDYRPGWELK